MALLSWYLAGWQRHPKIFIRMAEAFGGSISSEASSPQAFETIPINFTLAQYESYNGGVSNTININPFKIIIIHLQYMRWGMGTTSSSSTMSGATALSAWPIIATEPISDVYVSGVCYDFPLNVNQSGAFGIASTGDDYYELKINITSSAIIFNAYYKATIISPAVARWLITGYAFIQRNE